MDFFAVIPGKEQTGNCCVKGCRHKVRKDRSHSGRFCRRCRDRRYKLMNPIAYAWDKLKWSARSRKIEFSLTKAEFWRWCYDTGYIEHKGNTASSLSVDRVKPWLGYSLDNIQTLTRSENSRKQHVDAMLAALYPPPDPDEGFEYEPEEYSMAGTGERFPF